jgi:hypothetical protein
MSIGDGCSKDSRCDKATALLLLRLKTHGEALLSHSPTVYRSNNTLGRWGHMIGMQPCDQ